MPLYNLTKEKVEELIEKEKDKNIEYDTLEKLTIKEIWLSELENLEDKYITPLEI